MEIVPYLDFLITPLLGIHMNRIIGLTSIKNNKIVKPLLKENRILLNTDNAHTEGYFSLIAPHFEHFSQRDAGIGISSINVLVILQKQDLLDVLKIISNINDNLETYPNSWRDFLGTVKSHNQETVRIEPLLFKSRALKILDMLQKTVERAIDLDSVICYGTGVCYTSLCGIKLPPGTKTYS